MTTLAQLAVMVVMASGWGYWLWRLLGSPAAMRNLCWLWCGMSGFALGVLALQALVYLDIPLRNSAPYGLGVACAGFAVWGYELVRRRAAVRRRWREVAWVGMAGVLAGAGQSISLVGVGGDRFLGHAQIDHVNYVLTAQFLADVRFSTTPQQIGLRPWLWYPLESKKTRLTQSVALGTFAVLSRTDAQRVWGATAIFSLMLLAMAIAGMAIVVGAAPAGLGAALGLVAALLPVMTNIYLLGSYSQLITMFTFPALIAVVRVGALPLRPAVGLAVLLLAFLFGAYPPFFPAAAGVVAFSVLGWRLDLARRLLFAALIVVGAIGLTTGFVWFLPDMVSESLMTMATPDTLSGFAPLAGTWAGWGRNFIDGPNAWMAAAGGILTAGMLLGIYLQPVHRRRWWCAAFAMPGLMVAGLALRTELPLYPFHKLLVGFAPVSLVLGALGYWQAAGRLGRGARRAMIAVFVLAGGLVVKSSVQLHRQLLADTIRNREPLDHLWAARARAAADPARAYLIATGNPLNGAWLAYFGRASAVYYDAPAIADRRIPSESVAFRKVPAGVALEWLDPDRRGPVHGRESSPSFELLGTHDSFTLNDRKVYVVGAHSRILLRRAEGFAPLEQEYVLECGVVLLPGISRCLVQISDRHGAQPEITVTRPALLHFRLRALPGENVYALNLRQTGAALAATEKQSLALLQQLSLERADR